MEVTDGRGFVWSLMVSATVPMEEAIDRDLGNIDSDDLPVPQT